MAKKTVPFNQKGIEKLPDDKPVVYKILTEGGARTTTQVSPSGGACRIDCRSISQVVRTTFRAQKFKSSRCPASRKPRRRRAESFHARSLRTMKRASERSNNRLQRTVRFAARR